MIDKDPSPMAPGVPSADLGKQGQRRRTVLLKGLSKGAVLGAAALPLHSLANVGFGSSVNIPAGQNCTVSGFHSAVLSKATSSAYCGAFVPSYFVLSEDPTATNRQLPGFVESGRWLSARNWPVLGNVSDPSQVTVAGLLGGTGINSPKALTALHELTDSGFFIAAYLSALKDAGPSGSVKVPFDAAYVVAQYNSGSPTPAAVEFFRALCVFSN